MKKGLAIALGMVMVALAGATSYAKAPIIAGVPDIVISDREDNTVTLDNNWFRFPDAFNVLDYTTDVDSPESDLIFAFVEQTTTDDIGIVLESDGNRVVRQIDGADRTNPSAWGSDEMTNVGGTRDYLLSFLDLVRSGTGSAPFPTPTGTDDDVTNPITLDLPWHNTAMDDVTLSGTSRDVYIYAADDVNASGADRVSYDIMSVISRNYGTDSLLGGASSVFQDTFQTGAGTQWTFASDGTGPLNDATSGQGSASGDTNGYLSLQSPLSDGAAGNYSWGRWKTVGPSTYQGLIPYTDPGAGPALVYVARLTMSHDVSDPVVVPQIRFGAIQSTVNTWTENWVTPINTGGAAANPEIPAQDELKTYKAIWAQMTDAPAFNELDPAVNGVADARTYNVFFDVADNDATQGGSWTLRNVRVDTVPRPASQTADYSTTDLQTGWTALYTQGTVTRAFNAGALTASDNGNPAGTAATGLNILEWGRDSGLDWTGGTVLRGTAVLSVPSTAERNNFHLFRLVTVIAPFANIASELNVEGWANGSIAQLPGIPFVPPVAPSTYAYEAYFPSQIQDDALLDATRTAFPGQINVRTRVDHINISGNGTTWHNPSAVTVHSVAYEVLSDSF